MKGLKRLGVLLLVALGLAVGACAPAAAPAPTPAPPAPTPTPAAPKGMVYALNNTSPQIIAIDAETNEIVKKADVPGLKTWTWTDDNNYYDGTHLWAGARDPDTNDVEVLLVNLDTLQVARRIPLGKDKNNLYIGKPSKRGRLFVGKHGSGQMAVIDLKSYEVLEIRDVPVGGEKGVTCDADVVTGTDGVERVYYPTRDTDKVVGLDTGTLQPTKIVDDDKGNLPLMLTVAPDNTIWVQEIGPNTNVVLDPVTLAVIARFPTGKGPALASFSPDGKLGYITGGDTVMTVADVQTRKVLRNVEVGANASKAGAHPNGKFVYVAVSRENSIAVVDTSTWQVVRRIDIGVSPNGLFVRKLGG